jgi:hypothetical protein
VCACVCVSVRVCVSKAFDIVVMSEFGHECNAFYVLKESAGPVVAGS